MRNVKEGIRLAENVINSAGVSATSLCLMQRIKAENASKWKHLQTKISPTCAWHTHFSDWNTPWANSLICKFNVPFAIPATTSI